MENSEFIDLKELVAQKPVARLKLPRRKIIPRADIDGVSESEKSLASGLYTMRSATIVDAAIAERLLDGKQHLKPVSTIDWGDFDIEVLVDMIVAFETKFVNVSSFPLPYQVEPQRRIIRSILRAEGAHITLLQARQSGKSFGVAGLLAILGTVLPALARQFPQQLGIYKNGFRMGVFAPTDQQAEIIYDYVSQFVRSDDARQLYADVEIDTGIKNFGNKWTNGSFVFCRSANPRTKIEGHPVDLLIIDESQDILEYMFEKSLYPMTSWNNGTVVHIGTCTEKSSYFKQVIQTNQLSDNYLLPIDRLHYQYPWNVVEKFNPRYAATIDRYRNKPGGMESRHFLLNYELKWLDEEAQPIKEAEFKKNVLRSDLGIKTFSSNPVVVGIDLARKVNSTVVTVGELMQVEMEYEDSTELAVGVRLCDWLELTRISYAEQQALIESFLSPFSNIVWLCIDSTGIGDPIAEALESALHGVRNFERINFTAKSKHYLMENFLSYYERKKLLVPADEDTKRLTKWRNFFLQMVNVQKVVQAGYAVFEKKQVEAARDDYVDSLLLCCMAATGASKSSGEIEIDSALESRFVKMRGLTEHTGNIEQLREHARTGRMRNDHLREGRRVKLFRGVF